jgi:phosphoribosylformylglycinamidine synthase
MAVGEAITNIAAAAIPKLSSVRLSANWMAACGEPGEDAALYDTVRAIGEELCPALGIAIPVGKDSLSMKTRWEVDGEARSVVAPLSLIVSAFAPVEDARRTLTPELKFDGEDTVLLLVDLGAGRDRLGGSAVAQVYGQFGDELPDLDDPARLAAFFAAVQTLNRDGLLLAYHDRSDGGLFATLVEMAFAAHCGLDIELPQGDAFAALFAEELGAVVQLRERDLPAARVVLAEHGLAERTRVTGRPARGGRVRIRAGETVLLDERRVDLHRAWSETSWRLQSLRDHPECAREEYDRLLDDDDPGLHADPSFDPGEDVAAPYVRSGHRPRGRTAGGAG